METVNGVLHNRWVVILASLVVGFAIYHALQRG
jgi:hypothetical protein